MALSSFSTVPSGQQVLALVKLLLSLPSSWPPLTAARAGGEHRGLAVREDSSAQLSWGPLSRAPPFSRPRIPLPPTGMVASTL